MEKANKRTFSLVGHFDTKKGLKPQNQLFYGVRCKDLNKLLVFKEKDVQGMIIKGLDKNEETEVKDNLKELLQVSNEKSRLQLDKQLLKFNIRAFLFEINLIDNGSDYASSLKEYLEKNPTALDNLHSLNNKIQNKLHNK